MHKEAYNNNNNNNKIYQEKTFTDLHWKLQVFAGA